MKPVVPISAFLPRLCRMAAEVERHVDKDGDDDDDSSGSYSDVNFAYGSTPYGSWLEVWE